MAYKVDRGGSEGSEAPNESPEECARRFSESLPFTVEVWEERRLADLIAARERRWVAALERERALLRAAVGLASSLERLIPEVGRVCDEYARWRSDERPPIPEGSGSPQPVGHVGKETPPAWGERPERPCVPPCPGAPNVDAGEVWGDFRLYRDCPRHGGRLA